jgi:predicted negative regulator of RcsB-dependent stress response
MAMDESEQLETLKRWWDRYGAWLLGGLVVVIGGFFGWQGYQEYTTRQAERAAQLYQEYVDLRQAAVLREGTVPPELTAVLQQIDTDFRGTSYHTFTLLYRAHDAAELQDFDAAANFLRDAVDSTRSRRLRDLARVRLARVEHQLGNTERALDLLRQTTGPGFRSLVAEIRGDILLSKNDREGARAAYEHALGLAEPGAPRGLLEIKLADLATES